MFRLHLNRQVDANTGQPLKKVTQNYHIIALRNFLKYMAKRGIKCVSAEKIELGKQEDREVTFLERNELNRLNAGGFEAEANSIRSKLKNVSLIPEIEQESPEFWIARTSFISHD